MAESPDCNDPPPTHEYKGRTISLRVVQNVDGRWRCRYVFIRFNPVTSAYISEYPDGSFATPEEAEAMALERAQYLIDAD